ncbi:DinB family protein [Amycolatopsis alkalitolerans]|uniref:DinB family protein n=2 Tax=Amycolatopsis alkalitolerans TaxID=2547244 RepID=A0A5C4M339_9PSEU|nr:DinB family protein [Amycolatopsis alkalitolerans]
MLAGYLAWHRSVLLTKCAGLTGEELARRTVPPSTLSLLGLIRHLAKVERIWLRERFAGEPVERLHPGTDTDFDEVDAAKAAEDYERLLAEMRTADKIFAGAALDDTFTHEGETFSVRFLYLHLIQEYARHNGHADLLRERTDGATGA